MHHDTLFVLSYTKTQRILFEKTIVLCEENIYSVSLSMGALADFYQCPCYMNRSPRNHGGLLYLESWDQYLNMSLEAKPGQR